MPTRQGERFLKKGSTYRRFSCRRTTILAVRIHPMNLKNQLGDVETNRSDHCHVGSSESWLPQLQPRPRALACRWRSRPQHHFRTSRYRLEAGQWTWGRWAALTDALRRNFHSACDTAGSKARSTLPLSSNGTSSRMMLVP